MQRSYMQLISIQKLVRLAQVVEQWTGNPEVEGSSLPTDHLTFGYLRNSSDFLYEARCTQNFEYYYLCHVITS